MSFAVVDFNTVKQIKYVITIKIVLKSAQPNKLGLAADCYIERRSAGRPPTTHTTGP